MKKLGLFFLSLLTLSNCLAVMQPVQLAGDNRIMIVAYSSYNVVPVFGTPFTTTQIILSKDELIENIQNGDLAAWTVSVDKDIPYMLFIKPTVYHSNTNMTVVTNKHIYYFHLITNSDSTTKKRITYAIKFVYPEEQTTKIEKAMIHLEEQRQTELSAFANPANYNWNYSFNGDPTIVPIHVFDDGKFTYLQLQPNQPIPAVFVVDNPNGKESVVNYRQNKNYLVIQRTAPQFTLRFGASHVASIFNNNLIAKLENNN
ncbi:MAG: hypothetical protein A3E87_06595 [Gammaproteobacteria bacterium RIFCSPHIGHO2_12_FULL_35_23]|nr:MAG: hypothetical protein A3E87_06595 [Gammaproteobacteria bacterium RIFCSPHIGHO2_12_FULL_35_23]